MFGGCGGRVQDIWGFKTCAAKLSESASSALIHSRAIGGVFLELAIYANTRTSLHVIKTRRCLVFEQAAILSVARDAVKGVLGSTLLIGGVI